MSETKKKATPKSDPVPKNSIAPIPLFRNLTEDEIDVRVARVSITEVELLLYKDARADMNILDETVGPWNWTRDHKEIKGVLFCTVGIRNSAGEWIYKTDCGAESNLEPEKGAASDSFKRACFNFGLGRELYTVGQIRTSIATIKPGTPKNKCYDHFTVEHIKTEDGRITEISIFNETLNKRAYAWSKTKGVIVQ